MKIRETIVTMVVEVCGGLVIVAVVGKNGGSILSFFSLDLSFTFIWIETSRTLGVGGEDHSDWCIIQ